MKWYEDMQQVCEHTRGTDPASNGADFDQAAYHRNSPGTVEVICYPPTLKRALEFVCNHALKHDIKQVPKTCPKDVLKHDVEQVPKHALNMSLNMLTSDFGFEHAARPGPRP